MEVHNIKQEGEVFSTEARVQLSFLSYLKIATIMAFGWALVDLVIGIFTAHATNNDQSQSYFIYLWLIGVYVGLGFVKALFCGVISYPIYKWWCQRYRGQRVTGKFAIIVAP
jgi:hypothetical protein